MPALPLRCVAPVAEYPRHTSSMRANVRRSLIAAAAAACLASVAGCASTPAVPGAVTFQTRVAPMVGGFCSHFVESEPAKQWVESAPARKVPVDRCRNSH